jgi:asparagine synthase (glutamine-hydrolysing)
LAIEKFEELLSDSIKLQLRSDVTVGSCLSGGLDSSAIVCLMEKVLRGQAHEGIKTVTACFENKKYDEWEFAQTVINQTGAIAHRVYPSFKNLQESLDKLIWHLDEPFGSSSQYSQWSVFEGAASVGLKVMLDGQGSDEQLGGYSGNDLALYSGLLRKLKFGRILDEVSAFKKEYGIYPKSQLLGAFKKNIPLLESFLVDGKNKRPIGWMNANSVKPNSYASIPGSLQETLVQQTISSSLPALLRYEDRNSMAWSIESRVPFLDHRFVEFCLSLPEHLVYSKGVRKYILREALKNTFPNKIYQRRDKMGFVTPEEVWIKGEGQKWFLDCLTAASTNIPDLVNLSIVNREVESLFKGESKFNFKYWRLACFGNWLNMIHKTYKD